MILTAKNFKAVVASAGRFPSAGDFAGAGDYILHGADEGIFTIAALGVVSSWAKCRTKEPGNTFPTIAIDVRRIDGFAGLLDPDRLVELVVEKDVLTITSGRRELISTVKQAKFVKAPSALNNRTEIAVTEAMAKRCNYLADVAFADGSKPELNCVMLALRSAMAANQTTVALFRIDGPSGKIPIPLPVARVLQAGHKLYVGTADTVLRTHNAVYLAPAAVRAQTSFPVKALKAYGEQAVTEIAVCSGEKLAGVLQECANMLEPLSKMDIVLSVRIEEKTILFSGVNAGADFHDRIPLIRKIEEGRFRIPLSEAKKTIPFLSGKVVLTRGKHGDLLIKLTDGFVLFPAWIKPKK